MNAHPLELQTPEAQADLLRLGVSTWNLWRLKRPQVAVDLAGQSLSDLDLSNVNLGQADLSGTQFERVELDGANFSGATMAGVHFIDSPCPRAVFKGVRLRHAPLPHLQAREADFRGAVFEREGLLAHADLRGARFDGVDLSEVDLSHALLQGAQFEGARLRKTNLEHADLSQVDLQGADMAGARLAHAHLYGANLSKGTLFSCDFTGALMGGTHLQQSDLRQAVFVDANLTGAYLGGAWLEAARFDRARLQGSFFDGARLRHASLRQSQMAGANLERANLTGADLRDAVLTEANLQQAVLVGTDLRGADLRGAHVYGISAWDLKISAESRGLDLVITPPGVPQVVVDDIDVAQFTYLLLHNPNVRRVIDTIAKRGVLILGRFTEERKAVLDAMRTELRRLGCVPFLFDFDRPEDRSVRETVSILAGMSRLVIADLTQPASIPLELQAVIPQIEIPVAPIIAAGHTPFAMFADLYLQYRSDRGGHVLEVQSYATAEGLVKALEARILAPALQLGQTLARKKAGSVPVTPIEAD